MTSWESPRTIRVRPPPTIGKRNDRWRHHFFHGKRWKSLREAGRQRYLVNAYRVLLTRARQGMVIFVPRGDDMDPTRDRAFYDETFDYLARLGMQLT